MRCFTHVRTVYNVAALLLLALTLAACTSVDQTEHCIGTRYGKVIEPKMANGLNATIFEDATCFSLTDQNFPATSGEKETMEAQTKDPITVEGDVAIVYAFDPTTVTDVFLEKRSAAAAEVQILNAVRDGYRGAIASWTVNEIFSAQRSVLGDSVKAHIQRKLGKLAVVKQVYVRDIRVPEAIEQARVQAAKQQQIYDQAQKQLAIDSMQARGKVIQAQASAEAKRLEAQSYSSNPKLLDLEIAKASSGICSGVTTCVIGASPNSLLGIK
jgi:regulator of protease activity HflC (stomatin/prohibitin superfamily)